MLNTEKVEPFYHFGNNFHQIEMSMGYYRQNPLAWKILLHCYKYAIDSDQENSEKVVMLSCDLHIFTYRAQTWDMG